MAPWREWLGLSRRDGEEEAIDAELAGSLDQLRPPHARFLSAYAAVLARVAYTDRTIAPEEAAIMQKIIQDVDDVSARDAELIVAIASGGARRIADSESRGAARSLGAVATRAQRLGLLRSLFAVAAADRNISLDQLEEIERIGGELGLSAGDVESARLQFAG